MTNCKYFSVLLLYFLLVSLSGCSEEFIESEEIEPLPAPSDVSHFDYSASVYADIPGLGSCEGKSFQGFAVYNDIAFCFYNSGICRCVDLENKSVIAQFYLPAEAHHSNNHAGVACFSEEFYNDNDEFPLLYLSSYHENRCYVFRMSRNGAELVQSIYTFGGNTKNSGEMKLAPVLAYEPDGNLLLLKMRDANYHWISVKRPEVHKEKEVYIDLQDALGDFEVPSTSPYNAGFALNGKIYQLAGYKSDEFKLYILDYVNKKILVDEYWKYPILKKYEQEQCSRFRNGILVNYNGANQLVYVEFKGWAF